MGFGRMKKKGVPKKKRFWFLYAWKNEESFNKALSFFFKGRRKDFLRNEGFSWEGGFQKEGGFDE